MNLSEGAAPRRSPLRKPEWLKVGLPSGDGWRRVAALIERRGLHTVCESARCPNKGECWGSGTATFLVLGSVCTRACRFCAVDRGREGEALESDEPERLASAVAELGLEYAVVTSVDRDDLPDRGAAHFAACVAAIKARAPRARVEVLVPDYGEAELPLVLASGPDVVAHNVETVERLQSLRDRRASYAASLRTLRLAAASQAAPDGGGLPLVKSSLLLGLGEREDEVLATMDDLRAAGCGSLVLGQYLRPTTAQAEVAEYLHPEAFARYATEARRRGFSSVVSAPLARTSYHALDAFTSRGDAFASRDGAFASRDGAKASGGDGGLP